MSSSTVEVFAKFLQTGATVGRQLAIKDVLNEIEAHFLAANLKFGLTTMAAMAIATDRYKMLAEEGGAEQLVDAVESALVLIEYWGRTKTELTQLQQEFMKYTLTAANILLSRVASDLDA